MDAVHLKPLRLLDERDSGISGDETSETATASTRFPLIRRKADSIAARMAEADDIPALARLSQELLAYYGLPRPHQKSWMEHMIRDGIMSENPKVEVIVAEVRGEVVGFLAFGEMFALANCQNSFFIQDIFITRRHRSGGVGKALMVELLKIADARGVPQVDWTADPWNDQARHFYEKFGPVLKGEKIFYRLLGNHISGLIRKFT